MPVRPLSKELQAKAIKELHEKPERIQEDLEYIRTWLKKQPHLKARTDDQWLITFLRGCKFSLERTKEKIDFFYTMKTIVPEFLSNWDPMDPEIQRVLKLGVYLPLPNTDTADGPCVILTRPGIYDAHKYNVLNLMKVNFMVVMVFMMESDNMVISGGHIVQDLTNITIAHAIAMSPALSKKAAAIFQDAFPLRPKGMHFVNVPGFFESLFMVVKPFLKEKLLKRVSFLSGKNFDELYKKVPQRLFPKEYGGDAPSCDELAVYWKNKVESYRDWFLENEQYGTDESKRPGKPKTTENVFGLEGSFRKLNVD